MKKIYLKLTILILCLMATVGAMAQVTGYAITTNVNSKKCNIFSFDVSDPSTVNVIWTDTVDGEGAKLAALADSIYYVYLGTDESSLYDFCSINMTTGHRQLLNNGLIPNADDKWLDMCYDGVTKQLYGFRSSTSYDEEGNRLGTAYQICTINQSSGEWTEFATLPDGWATMNNSSGSYYLGAVCADGNGGIYVMGANKTSSSFWHSYINIYRLDLTTREGVKVFESDDATVVKVAYSNIVGAAAKVSMSLHEGKLYYIGNNNFLTMDVATGAVTKSAKNFSGEPVGLCFAMSTADGTPSDGTGGETSETDARIVKVVETYGDHMGERKGVMTHKTVSLYDGENRLQREATYGLSYVDRITGEESKWEIEYFKNFAYNEAGQLVKTYSEKYGIHDGTDLAFIDNEDTVTYEYNEAGLLVKETMEAAGYSMVYEYDEEGRLTKEIKQLPDYYNQYEGDYYNMYEITYSAFNAFGQPDSIHSTGLYDNDKYFGVYTYDEQGRKIAAHTWTLKDTTDVKMETWKYYAEGDTAMVYWVHEWFWGMDKGEKRTVYTYDNGNVNRTKEQVQTLTDGAWINEVTYTITELSEMNPDAVATLEVTDISHKSMHMIFNSAELTITLPDAAVTGTIAFDVYRHGILLTRLNATDAVDGKLVYADSGVKNGTYDYYVQTILINELMETEDALNISNVVTHTHYVELPVVTDIKCTSVRLEGGIYYATIEWSAVDLGEPTDNGQPWIGDAFQRYNVMLENMKAADNNETDGQALTWEVNCGYTGIVNLYIQTVYDYGKANSEMISVDCKALGIETTEAETLVTVNGNVVNVAAEADVTVYNAQGAQVAQAAQVTAFDLNVLPVGIYLVKVETAEGVQTVKVRR